VRAGAAPTFILSIIVAAWGLMGLAHLGGWAEFLGHDELIERGPGAWAALGLFLVSWQVMVAAMMLPSSLSTFRWFEGLVERRASGARLGVAFLLGYLSVWTVFGVAAFAGDGALHRFVDGWPWLAARPWLIGGSVLALAGGFELSRMAQRCRAAAIPTEDVPSGSRIAPVEAIRLGANHGLRRLRRCWPLMLLSFAVGMTSLVWMAVLTLVMALEGAGTWRRLAGAHAGAGLLALGTLVLAHPGWLPSLFPGTA
jgi:predicted metal-binding membrane protein